MPIRLRLAVAFAMIAAALYALGGWLFASGLSLTGGESQDVYEATVSQVVRELAIGGVVFVAIAALGAYWLARAALSPVVLTAITSTAGVARDRPPRSQNRRVTVSRQGRWSRPPRRCCPAAASSWTWQGTHAHDGSSACPRGVHVPRQRR